MNSTGPLHQAFRIAAGAHADRTAVVEPGHGSITYGELDLLSDRLRDQLAAMGVMRGDRVALYMRKSIDAVATILGILKSGAAYVPVDPGAPPHRAAYIMANCGVRTTLVESQFINRLREEFEPLGFDSPIIEVPGVGGGSGLGAALDPLSVPAAVGRDAPSAAGDLAYILYTSGSTGKPKGVMLSHENAASFVEWCSEVFQPTADDRFSAHAPFHFDLSILDLHVALRHGSTLVLIPEDTGKDPASLARLIADERISVWYSAPSILALLAQFGSLNQRDYSALRLVLFAGEVFAVKHLRTLCEAWQGPRYFNLYGPTETNVCTYHEVVPPVPAGRTAPYPIGHVCSHLRARVVDSSGSAVSEGDEGELCIAGQGVMQGYWALPEQTGNSFLVDDDETRWYRTGDIVVTSTEGYIYRGRRDRMVKRRGYRVELGEIEAGLYQHPGIKEVAVISRADGDADLQIFAFLSSREEKHPSLIAMKRFCSERLPLYMIPDRFTWLDTLPKTSTDKIDYQRLKGLD
jgi:amino acid adenylation domain-containing protein